jgi:hypothetical protein
MHTSLPVACSAVPATQLHVALGLVHCSLQHNVSHVCPPLSQHLSCVLSTPYLDPRLEALW